MILLFIYMNFDENSSVFPMKMQACKNLSKIIGIVYIYYYISIRLTVEDGESQRPKNPTAVGEHLETFSNVPFSIFKLSSFLSFTN